MKKNGLRRHIAGMHPLGTLNFVTVDIDTVGVGGVIFDGAVLAGTATFTQLDVNAGAGSQVGLGFADGTTGTVDVNGGTIENVEGEVIGLIESNVTFTYTGTVTQANASVPLILVDDDDTSTVTFESGSSLSDTAGVGIQLFNADGSYTFDGPVSVSGNDDDGIDIGTDSLGMATFNGSVTLNTGAGTAVDHGAATLSFTGGLDIDTSTGIGFLSTGGMANVTGTGNTIDISGGAAAVVVDTSSLNLNNTAVTTAGGDTVNTSDSTLSGMGNTTAALLSCNDGGGNTGNIPFNGGVDTCP